MLCAVRKIFIRKLYCISLFLPLAPSAYIKYNLIMKKVCVVDNNKNLYDCIKDCKAEIIFTTPEKRVDFDGYILINADNCADIHVHSSEGTGLILLSGDLSKVCEELLSCAGNVFCSIGAVRSFLCGDDIWHSAYFMQVRNNAELYLRYIGMNDKLSGFAYMGFIVAYLTFAEAASLKYDIFPVMEKYFGKSIQCMERAMRYAVESAWNKGDIFAQQQLFGYSVSPERGKPVALELAAMLSERIRDEFLYDRA